MRAQFVYTVLPRNPLLRTLALIGAVALAVALLTVGIVVGATVLVIAAAAIAIQRWRIGRAAHKAQAGIIEGEFTIVPDRASAELPHLD